MKHEDLKDDYSYQTASKMYKKKAPKLRKTAVYIFYKSTSLKEVIKQIFRLNR